MSKLVLGSLATLMPAQEKMGMWLGQVGLGR